MRGYARAVIAAVNGIDNDTFLHCFLATLAKINGIKINNPHGAFYAFPDVSSFFGKKDGDNILANAEDVAMYLLHKGQVTVVDGAAFGSPNNQN